MKRIKTLVALMVLAAVGLAAWAADAPPATQPEFLPIRYERNGGFVGTHDVVEIAPDGTVVVQGRLLGKGKGRLTPEQMTQLAGLFADWKSLKASYPAPEGSADGFELKIRYGKVEVSASDMNKDLPATFRKAQAAIEKIARDVTGK